MSRAINADELFRAMEDAEWYNNADRDEIAEKLVMDAPTIEPERKKGKWITCDILQEVKCSECRMCFRHKAKFCPNCGADMRGEQDE